MKPCPAGPRLPQNVWHDIWCQNMQQKLWEEERTSKGWRELKRKNDDSMTSNTCQMHIPWNMTIMKNVSIL